MRMPALHLILAPIVTLFLSLSGCGVEPAPESAATSALTPVENSAAPSANTQAVSSEEDGPISGGHDPVDPQGLGKQCWVDCGVVNTGAASCPSRITGHGETTFLGGCGKACGKAEGDAASKLSAGCSLDNCTRRGC